MFENPNYYHQDRTYKAKYICCECRKCFKRRTAKDAISKDSDSTLAKCPDCGRGTIWIGPKFRPPKTTDLNSWKSIGVLRRIGFAGFFGFGSDGLDIPKGPKKLKRFLQEWSERFNANGVGRAGVPKEAHDFNNELRRKIELELKNL